MKNSIILKTIFFVSIALFLVMGTLGYYLYTNQNEIIQHLEQKQKETILHQYDLEAKMKISDSLKTLKELAHSLKTSVALNLYNSDTEAEEKVLKQFLEKSNIKCVVVYDTTLDELFLIAYKKNHKIIFSNNLKECKTPTKLEYNLFKDKEKIGTLTVYYDNSNIIKQINKKKEEKIKCFEKEVKETKKTIKQKLIKQILIEIAGIIIVLLTIIILLNKLVKNPIVKLQEGLDSFFKFLNNPKNEITEIEYKSDDEIGKMVEEVNNNIQVSAKLHKEISQLIDIVDKNVLIINLNAEGKISKISNAFAKLTGYSPNELINQDFTLLLDDKFEKNIINQMWDTLNKNRIFYGTFQFKTKNNKIIFLEAIITPKCSKNSCSYDGILFDITNKKRVEELLETMEEKVEERTKDLNQAKEEIEDLLVNMKDSINYASFIQEAILPKEQLFKEAFKDYFIIWEPKDTVGGDIYQLFKIDEDNYILMLIDCTGHGVPGAFVTMLVKAVTDQIIFQLKEKKLSLSPSAILNYYNSTIKQILNQYETSTSKSNVGFDGGIIHYNKKEKRISFSGAQTPLFYTKNNEVKMVKGDKISIGYKKSPENYSFKETTIEIENNMKFYFTTDGFIDQNGGPKDMPFGKKRFKRLIETYHKLSMKEQKKHFLTALSNWQKGERNDDITVIGFEP